MYSAIGSSERIFQLIERIPITSIYGGKKLEKVEGNLSIEKISFSYPSRPNENVLENIDIKLYPGKTVALVGKSGSGFFFFLIFFNFFNFNF